MSQSSKYESLYWAMTGPLTAHKERALSSGDAHRHALSALDLISPQIDGGFDPQKKLKTGLPLGASLLSLPSDCFVEPLMDEWLRRYGVGAVFPPDTEPSQATRWTRRLASALKKGFDLKAKGEASVLKWVLAHGPDSQLPISEFPELITLLEAKRSKGDLSPVEDEVRARVLEAVGQTVDMTRPAIRWTEVKLREDEESMEVLCPSGRLRKLGDLRDLRRTYPTSREPSQSPLPDPEHKRRLDLARHFVLDPDIDLDTARARLWSTTRQNVSSVWTLLEWMDNPPRHTPDCRARMTEIIQARDVYGRSFLGFLASMSPLADDEDEQLADYLLNPSRGLIAESDVLGAKGEGLLEQSLVGVRENKELDAFNHHGAVKDWVVERFGKQAFVGADARKDDMIDSLVDGAFPAASTMGSSIAQKMCGLSGSAKLEQALLWGQFNGLMGSPPEITTQTGRAGNTQKSQANTLSLRLHEVMSQLTRSLEEHPGVLAIGKTEWDQWESMFYSKANSYMVSSAFKNVIRRLAPALERAVMANSLELEVSAAPTASVRPRSRI